MMGAKTFEFVFLDIMRIFFPWILCMVSLVQGFAINGVVLVLCMKTNNWLRYGNFVNAHTSDMSIVTSHGALQKDL
jgi:hypothetical protein